MQRWSWFLAVKGNKPEGALEPPRESDAMEVDSGAESWWGFWDPVEIRKLAEWLEIKHGLDNDSSVNSTKLTNGSSQSKGKAKSNSSVLSLSREPSPLSDLSANGPADTDDEDQDPTKALGKPTKKDMCALVKGLKQYAEMLEWRVQRASAADDA